MYGRLDDLAGLRLDTSVASPGTSFNMRNQMTNTETTEVFRRAVDGLTEYQREQLEKFSNYERLKAERLIRESSINTKQQ
jgi:hypothetical protein